MKITLSLICLLVALTTTVSAQQTGMNARWEEANTKYINANYIEAIHDFEEILSNGFESDKLYLNLGNAYFKRSMYGKAILNYNRALQLSPWMEDAQYNLTIANTMIKDKIETVPTFFVKRWINELRVSLSSNLWAGLSLTFLLLLSLSIVLYLLSSHLRYRKLGFYVSVVCVCLMVTSSLFAYKNKQSIVNPSEAIVTGSAVAVKSSPDASSKDIFIIHEGTKVKVRDSLGDFIEISIADGNRGWIKKISVELID